MPPRSSSQNPDTASAARAAGTEPIRIRKIALTRKETASTPIAAPGTDRDHEQPAERRTEHRPDVLREAHQRVRLLQVLGPGDLRDEAARGRPEERLEGPVDGDERDQHPQLGGARQQQRGDHRLHDHPSEIGHEHEPSAGQAVCPDACRQDQQGEREGLRGEHEAELAGAPVELVEHRERERHREQRIADEGDRLPGEQQAQLADPQRGQRVGEAGGRHGAGRLGPRRAAAYGGGTTP